jgi:hypothetical protein
LIVNLVMLYGALRGAFRQHIHTLYGGDGSVVP